MYLRYYLVGMIIPRPRLSERARSPPPCVVANCVLLFCTLPNALTAKFKNPTLEKVNPAPTTGGRGLEALSNFSVFVFDFTSYQFVTPPAVLRAYESC